MANMLFVTTKQEILDGEDKYTTCVGPVPDGVDPKGYIKELFPDGVKAFYEAYYEIYEPTHPVAPQLSRIQGVYWVLTDRI